MLTLCSAELCVLHVCVQERHRIDTETREDIRPAIDSLLSLATCMHESKSNDKELQRKHQRETEIHFGRFVQTCAPRDWEVLEVLGELEVLEK